MQRARYDQFLASEVRTLVRDAHGNVLDEASQMPPHLLLQQCVRLGSRLLTLHNDLPKTVA